VDWRSERGALSRPNGTGFDYAAVAVSVR